MHTNTGPRRAQDPPRSLPAALCRSLLGAVAMVILGLTDGALAADWIRAGINIDQPIWGLRDGLQFAIPPGGFTSGSGGPRGLIRVGYPTLPEGRCDLINFIAI